MAFVMFLVTVPCEEQHFEDIEEEKLLTNEEIKELNEDKGENEKDKVEQKTPGEENGGADGGTENTETTDTDNGAVAVTESITNSWEDIPKEKKSISSSSASLDTATAVNNDTTTSTEPASNTKIASLDNGGGGGEKKKVSIVDDVKKSQSNDSVASKTSGEIAENKGSENKLRKLKKLKSGEDWSSRLKALLKDVKRVTWRKTESGNDWEVSFQVRENRIDTLLNAFLNAGIGNNEYTSISVLPVNIHFPTAVENESESAEIQEFRKTVKSRMNVSQVVTSVRNGSQFTFDYVMLLILASMIAGIGLLENSSVLLVASMLVSPLMGPILGGTFGLVLQSRRVWRPAVLNELIGLSICLLCGFVFGLLTFIGGLPGWDVVTVEMKSRGQPRGLVVGLLVAIPSGAAVALSFLGGNFGSLVGVAISASLLPPAVNAGMFWAFAMVCSAHGGPLPTTQSSNGNGGVATPTKILEYAPRELASLGAISMSLTIINIIVIFIMGVLVLKIKEVAPHTATAVTAAFWRKDLKETREIMNKHHTDSVEETVISDYSKLRNIDMSNKDTIHGPQGRKIMREINLMVEGIEKDSDFGAVGDRLALKPGSCLNQMKKVVGNVKSTSRFQVDKVSVVELSTKQITYHDRFKRTLYDEVDTFSVKPANKVKFDEIDNSTTTFKKSPSSGVVSSSPKAVTIDMKKSESMNQPLLSVDNSTATV